MSHTHSGANVNSQLTDKPGGELIEPYIEHLTEQIGAAILEARAALAPAWVTWGTGRCALATNRDFWDAAAERFAAGYNPDGPPTTRSLVARVTGEDGEVRATLFNYACHPTTLAWENRLLSPDYIGAAREVLEKAFGAPALFFQGASGDLAPRDDYVGDTAVADRNGRQLGHAAAAAIENLPPRRDRFVYTGIVQGNLDAGELDQLVPARCRTSATLRATIMRAHRAGRGSAADQHVAHARRRERQLAAGRQAGRRADRALHRAPDRADRRGDPRGAGGAGAGVGDVRDGPLRAGDQPGLLGRRGASASPAATTPTRRPTTRWWSRGSRARTASCARRCSTTRAIRRRSPGENRLLSPDYIGAAREVLEDAFGAPALFFQGASGDLAPRDDYVGDTAVADRNGRQLGYAAAAAIESLPPPGTRFVYTGIVASGANLGTWEYQPCDAEQLRASEQLAARVSHVAAAPQGGDRRRREPLARPRLGPGAGEGAAPPLPQPGARRRSGLRDAALDLAARRRAAGRGPERALLGLPGRAAAAPRRDARCSCSA